MKKVVLTFGLIAGILVVGLMFFTLPKEKQDFEMGEILGYATMLVALSSIFFGIKTLRDRYEGGTITFQRAFLCGLYITLIASFIYAFGWEFYYQNSGANFMTQYSAAQMDKLKASGASDKEILLAMDKMKSMMEYYRNPLIRFFMTLMEILPVGLLISLISAAILRKKGNLPTATA
jgi:hypothetical protein